MAVKGAAKSHSAWLQVVARHQSDLAIATVDCRLPPAVVLVPQHCQHVTLGKAQLLGDGCLVDEEGAS